ncbi:hypothetical protein Tco_0011504 [Tanacetum coccineum]
MRVGVSSPLDIVIERNAKSQSRDSGRIHNFTKEIVDHLQGSYPQEVGESHLIQWVLVRLPRSKSHNITTSTRQDKTIKTKQDKTDKPSIILTIKYHEKNGL